MRISDLGEFALIERLQRIIHTERDDVIVGIGDDAAVLADNDGHYLLATVDSHVEQIHFLRYLSTPEQLGRRALVVNLSDIAAMGGEPTFALVSLALPPDTDVAWMEGCYRGIRAEADQAGVVIVGGNVTRSTSGVLIDITLLGRVRREHVMLRSGARPGDKVLVTDMVGDALAGLHLVFNPRMPVDAPVRTKLITRYLEPRARLAEAAIIAQSGMATAMLDVSDGLSGDIGHICEQSNVGVRVWTDCLPISPEARLVAEAMEQPAWQLALEGGDDYGLCFTVRREAADDLRARIERETGTLVYEIGEIVPAEHGQHCVLPDNRDIPLHSTAWQHFKEVKP